VLNRRVILICGLAFGMVSASTVSASVAPPPPSFIDDIAKQIVPAPTASSFDHYVAVFADDLTVTMDGKQIAPNKVAWVATERHRLGKVDRFVVGFAKGYDALLVIERYDDRSGISPEMLADPRYTARAVRYAVGSDHLVHNIQIVQTDGILQTPK